MDWKPLSEAPKPRDWMRDEPGQFYVIACFHQCEDDDGEKVGPPELRWAQVATLSFDGWHVGTYGFAAIHGFASFRLGESAGTHFAPLPLTLPTVAA